MLEPHIGDGVGADVVAQCGLRGSVASAGAIRAMLHCGFFLLDRHKSLRLVAISNAIARVAPWARPLGPGGIVLFVKLTEFCGTAHRNSDCTTEQGIESFYPEHLAREHCTDVPGDRLGDCVQVERSTEFLLHRGDRLGCDAAGDDQVEETEVGIYVEGEAVRGD